MTPTAGDSMGDLTGYTLRGAVIRFDEPGTLLVLACDECHSAVLLPDIDAHTRYHQYNRPVVIR